MPEGERINSQSSGIFILKNMTLDFLVINTFNTTTLGIADTSVYDTDPPVVTAPTMEITIPGFTVPVSLPFVVNSFNVYNSITLGLSTITEGLQPLPDGIYFMRYSVTPAYINFVEKNIMRTEKIQEKFDNAFMKLDMMECDSAIRTQSKVNLNSIYYMIQGSIAAANNCAIDTANKLYIQADRQLNYFISNNCGCSGNNYINNFQ
jgi:hypothetical protein